MSPSKHNLTDAGVPPWLLHLREVMDTFSPDGLDTSLTGWYGPGRYRILVTLGPAMNTTEARNSLILGLGMHGFLPEFNQSTFEKLLPHEFSNPEWKVWLAVIGPMGNRLKLLAAHTPTVTALLTNSKSGA